MTFAGMARETRLSRLLAGLRPRRRAGTYVFAHAPDAARVDTRDCLCVLREADGLSLIVEHTRVPTGTLCDDYRAAWITLSVDSALADVGLTATVSQCLAEAGIACNVVAGIRHDHLFVPEDRAEHAMRLLEDLQHEARQRLAEAPSSALAP